MSPTTALLITTNLTRFLLTAIYHYNWKFAIFDLLCNFAFALLQKYKPSIAYHFLIFGGVLYNVFYLIFIVNR